MELLIFCGIGVAIIALFYAFILHIRIKRTSPGNERMRELSSYIQKGSMAFLFREYKILLIFCVVLFLIIGLFLNPSQIGTCVNSWLTACSFLFGSVLVNVLRCQFMWDNAIILCAALLNYTAPSPASKIFKNEENICVS